MAVITRPYVFSSGAVIFASEVNSVFSTMYNEFNGNIDNDNIKAGAGIVASKLNLSTMPTVGATSPGSASFTNISFTSGKLTTTNILVNASGSATVIEIKQPSELGSGYHSLKIESTAQQTNSNLVLINQSNTNSRQAPVVFRMSGGTGANILLDALGNNPHLRFTGDPTVVGADDGSMWFDGTNLFFRVGAATKTIDWT